ncbi:MAG: glycosyltransferase family 4 protein, partial [Candidatus Sericytochromatia bacterium]|nr:glycosyltransferase family 4 protein [Candidatus Sericytochromatia bacterium]
MTIIAIFLMALRVWMAYLKIKKLAKTNRGDRVEKRIKIALVIQRCGESVFGGAEKYILELAKACLAHGAEVEVFSSQSTSYLQWNNNLPINEMLFFSGCECPLNIRRFPVQFSRQRIAFAFVRRVYSALNKVTKWAGLNSILRNLFLIFQGPWCPSLWKTIERECLNYDLFVFGGYLYAPSVKGADALKCLNKSVLIPMAHAEPEFYLPFVGELLANVEHLAYLSKAEQKLTELIWPDAKQKKKFFLPPGLNISMSEGLLEHPERVPERFLLYVGRVDRNKGVDFLLENIPADIPVVFAGDNSMEAASSENRIFLGKVSDELRDYLIRQAAALVIASRFESYSMVTADAIAFGKPVLALRGCGPIDELLEAYGGYSVDSSQFAVWAR